MTTTKGRNKLVIITQLTSTYSPNNTVRLTEKFVEGVKVFADHWKGSIKVLMHNQPDASGNLDLHLYQISDLPFEIEIFNFHNLAAIKNQIIGASAVQGGSSYHLNGLAQYCKENNIAYIHCSEYSLKTRCQIINANTNNPIKRLRRYLWEWRQERANKNEVTLASATHCNGTPTFNIYKYLNPEHLLYFDNRITEEILISEKELKAIPEKFSIERPVRLAFSGRLNKMKGADALIRIARILKDRKLPFELNIYGGGSLEEQMKVEIQDKGLDKHVKMNGVLDFATELVPSLKRDVDLFVCCHVQGDPSCTYVETFACGIPIVGYLNEAFEGILGEVDAGWGAPILDDNGIADKIEEVIKNPNLLDLPRKNAIKFATKNTFHEVFRARCEHIMSCLK